MKHTKLFFKIVTVAMILSLLSTSILQTTASAATSGDSVTVGDELVEFENVDQNADPVDDESYSKASGKTALTIFKAFLVTYVGLTLANTIMANAVNNGIDAACDEYDHIWGVKQACKLVKR